MTPASAKIGTAGHADLMDGIYRRQRHIYDLTRKYYLLGRDDCIRGLDLAPGESLLEVGCGTGRNLAVAHRRYPEAHLYGLDISQEMLISARKSLEARGTDARLLAADATGFTSSDFSISGFDRIMISYALSMIPDWQRAIAASLDALAPGGSLHIVDFGQQQGLPRWFRTGLHAWLGRFHVTPRADLPSVLADFADRHGASLDFTELYRGYAWKAVLTRKGEKFSLK